MRYLMYQPAMPDTASHASARRQARTDGGGGEKVMPSYSSEMSSVGVSG